MNLYKYVDGKCNASGAKIRELRECAGLSQEQLAGLNLNQKAISRIETGIRVVPDYELIYFSGVLDVPVCKLLEQDE